MSLIELNWILHGMGVATATIYKDEESDIRLHYWSRNFLKDKIGPLTGAIHRHSFDMISTVLKGRVTTTGIRYSRVFEPNTACGDELWNCWTYNNNKPSLTSAGYLEVLETQSFEAGQTWEMKAGDIHYFEAEEAITLVQRKHNFKVPNDVFVSQAISEEAPINGRSCFTEEEIYELSKGLPNFLLNDVNNFKLIWI